MGNEVDILEMAKPRIIPVLFTETELTLLIYYLLTPPSEVAQSAHEVIDIVASLVKAASRREEVG